jgi:quercetin dioxygenase-like cupin family protein
MSNLASARAAALSALVDTARSREPLGADQPPEAFVADGLAEHPAVYANRNDRLNIDFSVVRLAFPHAQTMDPRVVRIAPGRNNERHRHAHESIFVVLQGRAEVAIGDAWQTLEQGGVAFVPRWIFHQTRNPSPTDELVLLAITDFGFTSAVLGDYDRRTRLAEQGADASATATAGASASPPPSGPRPDPVAVRARVVSTASPSAGAPSTPEEVDPDDDTDPSGTPRADGASGQHRFSLGWVRGLVGRKRPP